MRRGNAGLLGADPDVISAFEAELHCGVLAGFARVVVYNVISAFEAELHCGSHSLVATSLVGSA